MPRLPLATFFEELAAGRRRKALSGTLAGAAPWVRHTQQSAAERYELQPDYARFDQKFNMMRQGLWNPRWAHTVAKAAIARVPALNPLIASLDDLLGYGEPNPRGYWL